MSALVPPPIQGETRPHSVVIVDENAVKVRSHPSSPPQADPSGNTSSPKRLQLFFDSSCGNPTAPKRKMTARRFGLKRPTPSSSEVGTGKNRGIRISEGTSTSHVKKRKTKTPSPIAMDVDPFCGERSKTPSPIAMDEDPFCGERSKTPEPVIYHSLRRTTQAVAAKTAPCNQPMQIPRAPKKRAPEPRLSVAAAGQCDPTPAVPGPSRRRDSPRQVPGPSRRRNPPSARNQESDSSNDDDDICEQRKKINEMLLVVNQLAKRHPKEGPKSNRPLGRPRNQSWKCDDCEKVFTNKQLYKKHIEAHTDVRDFCCSHPGCTRAFNNQSALDSHAQTHLDREDRPIFKCRGCGKAFTRGADVQKHIDRANCTYRRYKRIDPSGSWRYGNNKPPGSESSSDEDKERTVRRSKAPINSSARKTQPVPCNPKVPLPGPLEPVPRRCRAKQVEPQTSDSSDDDNQ